MRQSTDDRLFMESINKVLERLSEIYVNGKVSYRVIFEGIEKLKLKPGTFEFEAIADFSLDSDDVLGTKIEILVSDIQEVE